jgi:hypothetical protein
VNSPSPLIPALICFGIALGVALVCVFLLLWSS